MYVSPVVSKALASLVSSTLRILTAVLTPLPENYISAI